MVPDHDMNKIYSKYCTRKKVPLGELSSASVLACSPSCTIYLYSQIQLQVSEHQVEASHAGLAAARRRGVEEAEDEGRT